MSVFISPENSDYDLNLSNDNFIKLWAALGIESFTPDGLCGEISSHDLSILCKRYKMRESVKGLDKEVPTVKKGNIIHCGTAEGYISRRVNDLLAMMEAFPNTKIIWG